MHASSPLMLCLTSIQVIRRASQLHPDHIAHPSRSPDVHFTSIQVPSHLRPQYVCLTYIQVASHLHLGPDDCILALSRSHLTPIHVWRYVSHLCPFHVSFSFKSPELHRCSIPVPPHLHPGPWILISPPTCYVQVSRISLHLHPAPISAPYTSQNVRLTSIQVSSHLSPDQKIRVSPPPRSVHPGCVLPPCRS